MYHPTTRVLTILEMLQAQPGLSGAAIAKQLEVDRRTVRRYISWLCTTAIKTSRRCAMHPRGLVLLPALYVLSFETPIML
ncbi:MAG: HTH domain-containing protein [Roseiflexaceae bacterium]